MKLLMISTDRNIFDKESAVAKRQIEYAEKYEEVHIVVFANKKYVETSLGSKVFVYPTRSGSRWTYVFDALKLARFIVEKRNITHMTCQDPFETGLVGALVRNRHKVELELQVHTDIGSSYFQNFTFLNKVRMLISRYTLPRADAVRVVSEKVREYVTQYVDTSKVSVRPVPMDIEKIKQMPVTTDLRKKYPQFTKKVVMVSRLEKEKNVEMALRAWKIVRNEKGDAGLVIVGSGSEEKNLKDLARNLNIENSVQFEGWQNDTVSYLKTSDCYLHTSWYEGYGMTLVEAHAVGVPIVSTDVGVAREIGAEIVEHTPEAIARGIISKI